MKEYYEQFIKGKSVALVGPAEYLTSSGLGEEIDSKDIVVRINRGMELIDRYSDHLGKRTDILYNCLISEPDNGGEVDVDEWSRRGVKWVSTIPGSSPSGECKSAELHHMVKSDEVDLIQSRFHFYVMDYHDYAELNKNVSCRANTGFAAIFDLLNHGCSSLFVTGFSFYLDNFAEGYKSGCGRCEEEFAKQCFESKRHNQKNQWEYLKSRKDEIETDKVLKFILNMESLSRENFQDEFNNIHTD